MKILAVSGLLAASMLAGPALTQDKTAQPAADTQTSPMKTAPAGTAMPATANGAAAGSAGSGGMTTADTATAKIRFVTARPAEVTASKLVGQTLYNTQNENVGQTEDLFIDKGKTVSGVVVSVGGFLAMGERSVLGVNAPPRPCGPATVKALVVPAVSGRA